jgi:hypothetical protein
MFCANHNSKIVGQSGLDMAMAAGWPPFVVA